MRAYVLIHTEPGKEQMVVQVLRSLGDPRILHADAVVGPYDVVVECEGSSLDVLGAALEQQIQPVAGIASTTTCLSIKLA